MKRPPKQPKKVKPDEYIHDTLFISNTPLELRIEQARRRLYLTRYE